MSQLWVKPPLSLPHRCRLPAHWDVVSSLQVFRGLSGDKGSIYCSWIPCSCIGLGSRSHLCYRPGLWPSLPVAGTEDRGISMDWEPTTLPWSRALQPGESSEAGRFLPAPQPLLSLAPRRELAAASQCHQQEGPASEQNHHWDKTRWKCQNMHTHTGTRTRGGRAGGHTFTGTALAVTGV